MEHVPVVYTRIAQNSNIKIILFPDYYKLIVDAAGYYSTTSLESI